MTSKLEHVDYNTLITKENNITIDPGDHIGIISHYISENIYMGITLEGDDRLCNLWDYLERTNPKTVIFERFALRAKSAQKLVGNTFITCEVIGVIKLWCQLNNVKYVELLPSSKEYCGFSSHPKDPRYQEIQMVAYQKITEHVRDAFRLYNYYRLFGDS